MLYLIILLVVLDLGIIFLLSRKRADSSGEIKDKLIELSVELRHMKDEFPKNREENSKNLHQTREDSLIAYKFSVNS